MHLLLTRPGTGSEPDPLQEALQAAGHRVTRAPLLSIVATGAVPTFDGAQALIVTSRNALRAVAPAPEAALALPLYAVGPGTGALARALGFRRVVEGPGTGRELAALIAAQVDPAAGPLVYLAGETLAFDLKGALDAEGFTIRTEIVYRAEPAEAFPPDVVEPFRQGAFDAVVLMSPRTAKVYAKLVAESALTPAACRVVHFCLSDAVGRELNALGTVRIAVARLPNSQEMLALIAREASDSAEARLTPKG
jgi:uroporphyrinogen-III synthase